MDQLLDKNYLTIRLSFELPIIVNRRNQAITTKFKFNNYSCYVNLIFI